MRLLDFLFPPRADEKIVQGTTLDDFLSLVAPQLVSETRPETVALLPFSDTRVRSALHEAKYHGSERAFAYLGTALADFLPDYLTDFALVHVGRRTSNIYIVPVPLGKTRRKERGFNQAEEITKHAFRVLGTQNSFTLETDLLERVRETPTQIGFERSKREANMRGAFKTTRRVDPACTYILIDDVITTGATLQSAISALHSAGATHILPLALAH